MQILIPDALQQPGQWLALAAAALLLGACSSAPIEQSTGGLSTSAPLPLDTTATLPTEACGLLTPGEVASLTGQPCSSRPRATACRFVEADQPASPDAVVTVSFRPAAAFTIAQAGNNLKRSIAPVNGLGREAYYDDRHGDLYVRLPTRTLVIGMPRACTGLLARSGGPGAGPAGRGRLAAR